jgi:hypothetical protein
MVQKTFEPDDPMELVGVILPADAEAVRDMAYVFAEEFARLGFDQEQIMRLFQHPFYAGAHQAYGALGEEAIRTIVAECTQVWGRVRSAAPASAGQEGG